MWRFIQASGERDPQGGRKEEEEGSVKEVVCEIPGHGMFWEADECARCLRDVSGTRFFFFLGPGFGEEREGMRSERSADFFFLSPLIG